MQKQYHLSLSPGNNNKLDSPFFPKSSPPKLKIDVSIPIYPSCQNQTRQTLKSSYARKLPHSSSPAGKAAQPRIRAGIGFDVGKPIQNGVQGHSTYRVTQFKRRGIDDEW